MHPAEHFGGNLLMTLHEKLKYSTARTAKPVSRRTAVIVDIAAQRFLRKELGLTSAEIQSIVSGDTTNCPPDAMRN
jgi:hypothetical protein